MNSLESTLTVKGQITLPKSLRDMWHLKIGDKVVFEEIEGLGVVMRPRITEVSSLKGCVSYKGKAVSLEEMDLAISSHMKK